MKISLYFLMLVLLLSGFSVSAQSDDEKNQKVYAVGEQLILRRNIFKFTPGDLFSTTLTVGMERMNKTYTRSLNLQLSICSGETWQGDVYGFGGEVAYRFYSGRGLVLQESKKANKFIQGVYFAPFLRGGYINNLEDIGQNVYDPTTDTWNWIQISSETEVTYLFPGVYIGWQRTFWDLLYMDVFIGGGVRMANVKRENEPDDFFTDGIIDPEYNGVAPRLGFSLGVSF